MRCVRSCLLPPSLLPQLPIDLPTTSLLLPTLSPFCKNRIIFHCSCSSCCVSWRLGEAALLVYLLSSCLSAEHLRGENGIGWQASDSGWPLPFLTVPVCQRWVLTCETLCQGGGSHLARGWPSMSFSGLYYAWHCITKEKSTLSKTMTLTS